MNTTVKKILSVLGWIITIIIQFLVGMILCFLSGLMGVFIFTILIYPIVPIGLYGFAFAMSVGLGIVLGVFGIGILALALRKVENLKLYGRRLGFMFLLELIPIAILVEHPVATDMMSDNYTLPLSLIATVLSIIGFYVPVFFKYIKILLSHGAGNPEIMNN